MKPSQLTEALETLVLIRQPGFIWGQPGIGKSDIIRQVAARLNMDLNDVRMTLLDPVDLRGLPSIEGAKTTWNVPDFLPQTGQGILFLDELNAAPPMVQAAGYQLILDRQLGNYTLPDGWVVMAAGNGESDGAVTSRMPTPLRNRFVHLTAETDIGDWCSWAIGADIDPIVIAFLRWKSELLYSFSRDSKAFPTPRSWAFVSNIMANGAPSKEIEHLLIAGTVGDGAAVEFSAFLRLYRDLPSIDAIIMNPDTAAVPDSPQTLYAIASTLGKRMRVDNIGKILRYLGRIPGEFAAMSMKDAGKRDNGLFSTPEFRTWVIKNQDLLGI